MKCSSGLFFVAIVLCVGACTRTHPPIDGFLDSASRVKALCDQGVNFGAFSAELATAKARFDILDIDWPRDVPAEARGAFKESLRQWDIAHEFWEMKIKGLDSLRGADRANGYLRRYPGLQLVIRDGELSVPLEINISILLAGGSEFFDYGRQILLTRKSNLPPPVIAARAAFVIESPSSPLTLDLPSPSPTPTPRLAAAGTWFLTEWVTLKRDKALTGKMPATQVVERSRDGSTVHVHDGHDDFDVSATQLTNNIDWADTLKAEAIARQKELDNAGIDARREAAERERELNEKSDREKEARPKVKPPPYENPLDRPPHPREELRLGAGTWRGLWHPIACSPQNKPVVIGVRSGGEKEIEIP